MRNSFHILLSVTLLMLISCQQDSVISGDVSTDDAVIMDHYVPGKAVVMVSEALAEKLEAGQDTELFAGAIARRTFSNGGRFEERMRKEGLHLWYDAEFDREIPLTKAGETLLQTEGVKFVEFVPVPVSLSENVPFDDPYIKKQCHYFNQGGVANGLKTGCDINVVPAWKRGITGDERVVVAVLDGGVDIAHEDLMGNLWEGTDEKGNVIHGYDFVYDSYKIYPDEHGTHVAGTVAAVNNNGVGVAGVAGGDYAKGIKGARIMSCQIMNGDDFGNPASAMVWAANNGAHIAQNSWGFPEEQNPDMKDTPEYIKAAIDYFNTYAGCDENGNQAPDSPVKGGVVFFSAGNESSKTGYPASYPGCVAVSAISGDFKLASYSNYGDWIDIAAPGGESQKRQLIFSTVQDNGYESMQGTSMACPHVSGVAALILSEFGGPGFTREDLIERLLKTASDIGLPVNQTGAGMVNASAAVAHYGEDLPNVPVFARQDEESLSSLVLKYVMPDDNNGVECRSVDLFYSTESFEKPYDGIGRLSMSVARYNPGDTISFTIEGLELNTTYSFRVRANDVFGNVSQLSDPLTIKTRDNLAPVIEALDGTEKVIRKHMKPELRFRIVDPENGHFDVVYENATGHDVLSKEGEYYKVTINAREIPSGTYTSVITATDDIGKSSRCVLKFDIEENHSPEIIGQAENVLFTALSKKRTIRLDDYINDQDGEALEYSVSSSSASVAKASVADNVLTLESVGFGESLIAITASDAFSKSVKLEFKVVARDGSKLYDLYPNPVTDGKLRVRSSSGDEVAIRISGASGSLVYDGMIVPDPFEPAIVDMSETLAGVYSVTITDGSGKAFTQNIVKL